jgi:non-ribosomal peptide synthetase component E (peptide arylation enzyme)
LNPRSVISLKSRESGKIRRAVWHLERRRSLFEHRPLAPLAILAAQAWAYPALRMLLGAVTIDPLINILLAAGFDLAGHGIRPGNRVTVWLPSRVETAIALLACSRNSYVCCPSLHSDHTVGDVVALTKRMRASALILQAGYGADADRHCLHRTNPATSCVARGALTRDIRVCAEFAAQTEARVALKVYYDIRSSFARYQLDGAKPVASPTWGPTRNSARQSC